MIKLSRRSPVAFNCFSFTGALLSLACSSSATDESGTGGANSVATGGSLTSDAAGGNASGSGGLNSLASGGTNTVDGSTGGQATTGGAATGGNTASGGAGATGVEVDGTCFPLCGDGSTDDTGDGWGWENEESCVVSGGAADSKVSCGGVSPSGGAGAGGSTSEGSGGSGGSGSGGGGSSDSNCADGNAAGFYVEDGKLYDNRCNAFVMRGANVSHAWFKDETPSSLGDLASVGGNSVRIVMATGGRWDRTSGAEVTNLIDWAKTNQLVAMLEVHDSTGYAEQAGSEHPQNAVDYWVSDDIKAALIGQESFVLINIANEAFGNDTTSEWQSFHEGAVQDLRAAGLKHTLVVDAPNWGQDHTETMKNGGASRAIFDADPDKNVVFSVHMYDIYDSSNTISSYMQAFADKGLPLVVGEFAADHGVDKPIDQEAIMDYAGVFGFGYLGWSWSGNGEGLSSLDITQSFDVNNLSSWGESLINGPHGIKATSELCTCFD